jgi:hypothetical protein
MECDVSDANPPTLCDAAHTSMRCRWTQTETLPVRLRPAMAAGRAYLLPVENLTGAQMGALGTM